MPLPVHSTVREDIDSLQQPSLDPPTPEAWQELRALGHRMLDDIFDDLATLREQPAWRPMPEASATALSSPLPIQGRPAEEVYRTLMKHLVPYTIGNRHPRAWGWVRGTGTPLAMLADMLASGLNAHVAGGRQAPVVIEETCLRWLAELMGMPSQSSGLLTTGATMANLIGLAVARNAKAGYDIRQQGLQHCAHPQLLVYGSTETHSWALKAVELLGLGRDTYRRIPVTEMHQLDLDRLELQIEEDREAGHRPAVVIANCGTVNTGAIDNLPQSRHCAANMTSGSTWMALSARCCGSPKNMPDWCAASRRRIRWPSIFTNGFTCPLKSAACWCAMPSCIRLRLPHMRATSKRRRAASWPADCPLPIAAWN